MLKQIAVRASIASLEITHGVSDQTHFRSRPKDAGMSDCELEEVRREPPVAPRERSA